MVRAVVVSAVRTPIGRYGGALSGVRPDDLAGVAIAAAVERAGVDGGAVDDVYFGCANQAGEDNRNVARRDLGENVLCEVSQVLRDAIQCGLDNRAEALEYALQFGRGIDAAVADRFVSMYVNELTQDYGDEGRKAVTELLRRGEALGAFPEPVAIDFVR